MKIEVMTNGEFNGLADHYKFDAKQLYKSSIDLYNDTPYYEIWEIEKSNVRTIEAICIAEDVLFCYSKGANRGTPFEPLTINSQFVIGWTAINGKDTFNCLTDYFTDGLEVTNPYEVCACATTMAKTNGWSMSQLWKKLEG